MDIKNDNDGALSPQALSSMDQSLGEKLEAAALAGLAAQPLAKPTKESADLVWGALLSIKKVKGKSKAAVESKEILAGMAKAMVEAGWVGADMEARQARSLWDLMIESKRPRLVEAALAAGMRPWSGELHWRHEPVGLALYKGQFEAALLLARAMAPDDVRKASMSGDAMMFDLIGLECVGHPSATLMWEEWKSKGLSIDARNYGMPHGSTALMAACARGKDLAIAALLSFGADPNAVDEDGRSPLHLLCDAPYALLSGSKLAMDSLNALLRAGADPMAKDARGLTPIDIARGAKWDEAVALLAPFEQRVEIVAELSAEGASLLSAIAILRSRGYGLTDPSGQPVEWESALKDASKNVKAKRSGL